MKEYKIIKLPPATKKLWDKINKEVLYLHSQWKIYRQLYGTSEARCNFLTKTAGTCFAVIQESIYRSVQLQLCAFSDAAGGKNKSGSYENLSLKNLSTALETIAPNHPKIETLIKSFCTSCEPIRERRNKFIAHLDKPTALHARMQHVSRKRIEICLTKLTSLMAEIHTQLELEAEQISYEYLSLKGDGEDLIRILDRGWSTFSIKPPSL